MGALCHYASRLLCRSLQLRMCYIIEFISNIFPYVLEDNKNFAILYSSLRYLTNFVYHIKPKLFTLIHNTISMC